MKFWSRPVFAVIFVHTLQFTVLCLAIHELLHWPLTGKLALGLFATPLLCLYFLFVFVGRWSWGMPIRTRLSTEERAVAITFDDGPSEVTLQVLDCLALHQVKATFFLLGENIKLHPEIVRRIAAEGHTIGIHGYSHRSFVLLSRWQVRDEIQRAQSALEAACPGVQKIRWVRPPFGFKTLLLPWRIVRMERTLVTWSLDSRDYHAHHPKEIADRVADLISPGAIVLLHDGFVNAHTAEALPDLLKRLKAAKYQCVPL